MVKWLNDAVFYEIYPQSFCDTNADGIGDINGITAKLDYIADMGFNAIWINPCFKSPFMDAGYDVEDYYTVAPRYGTNEDLCNLFMEAHKKNIRILLDLVPGHTSDKCEWFKKSALPEKNEYTNRYIWTDSVWNQKTDGLKFVSGLYDRDANYIVNFFSSQPALNYGFNKCNESWELPYSHPDCRKTFLAMIDVMRFWLDKGADGFRVDMAYCLVKNDVNFSGTKKLWREVRAMLDKDYPEAVILSEWSDAENAIDAGFHMDFYLHFNNKGYNALFRSQKYNGVEVMEETYPFFSGSEKSDVTVFTEEFGRKFNYISGRGYMALPSGNHDMYRLSSDKSVADLKLSYAFIMTMPTVPFIYYGDEIGMAHNFNLPSKEGGYFRTGARTPMQWTNGKNDGFSEGDAKDLYLPVDESEDAVSVERQENDDSSLLSELKRLIKLRQTHDGLKVGGSYKVLYARKNAFPFVYERENYIIAVNPSDNEECVTLDEAVSETVYKIGNANFVSDNGKTSINMKRKSFIMLKK